MKKSILIFLLGGILCQFLFSQNAIVEGYVFEDGGRGYLNQVKVNIYEASSDDFIDQVTTNKEGFFTIQLPKNMNYKLEATKDVFENNLMEFSTTDEDKTFLKVVMLREDGYLFEVTLAPKRDSEDIAVDAIRGALIEVYNNTKQEEVLVLENHPSPDFKIQFKKGNHYTVMVRKEGYLVKRMEAFVNVEGCILCFEGVGEVKPGVTDNLTEGLSMGTLLANVELEQIFEGKIIELQNIYYEFGKANLTKQAREELKKLANILEDNKHLTVELGSHTDVRGTGPNNRSLSEKRAAAAVDYLTKELNVRSDRIIAVGYGESEIKNKCLPGVTCTEEEHGENRRTEIKILKMNESGMPMQSLTSMKKEEEFERMVLEGGVEQVKIGEGGKQIEEKKEAKDVEKVEEEEQNQTKNVEEKEQLIENDKVEVKGQQNEAEDILNKNSDVDGKTLLKEKEATVEKQVAEKLDVDNKTDMMIIKEEEAAKVKEELSINKKSAVPVQKVEKMLTKEEVVENVKSNEDDDSTDEIEDAFNGYRIVVHYSNFPVSGDHQIYSKFDKILTYETAQKNILYMVGTFKNVKEAEAYRASRVLSDFPGSYVVGFLNGKKITIE